MIAPSYSGLYFRNAFNLGLLLLTCPEAETLVEGERVRLDWQDPSRAPCVHTESGRTLVCANVPDFLLDMVRAGGLLPALTEKFQKKNP